MYTKTYGLVESVETRDEKEETFEISADRIAPAAVKNKQDDFELLTE